MENPPDVTKWRLYIRYNFTGSEQRLPFQVARVEPYNSRHEMEAAFKSYRGRTDIAIGFAQFLKPGKEHEHQIFGPPLAKQDHTKWYLYLEFGQQPNTDGYTLSTQGFVKCEGEDDAWVKINEYNQKITPHGGHIYEAILVPPTDNYGEPMTLIGET